MRVNHIIFRSFRDKSQGGGTKIPVGLPPAARAVLTSSWDTMGMLGHAFDHLAPLARLLEVIAAACSKVFFIGFSLISIGFH